MNMKFLVFSDSHGDMAAMSSVMRKHRSAEVVMFCGDGCNDLAKLRMDHPDKAFFAVSGNCDWYCSEPNYQVLELAGKKIFITHGHMFGVKQSTERLINVGRQNGCDIVLFGHTHKQLTTVEGGMLVLNPGSIGYGGRYSIIEIDEKTGKIKATEYPDDDYGPVII